MDIKSIDWNEAWKKARSERSRKWSDSAFWNKRAPSFAKHATESPYASDFIGIMQPGSHWSVLDVGCGAGTLALPLSRMVRRITALDRSGAMIALLEERVSKEVLTNITALTAGWEDDWEGIGIVAHDTVIASRSLIVEDLRAALDKLDRFARKKIYLSALVGDGPFDRRMHEAVGRELNTGPDYLYVYNLLHQMGILANVAFVTNRESKTFGSHEEALNSLRWMFADMSAEEEQRLAGYLKEKLVDQNGRWTMSHERVVRWAVIWWEKE
ncbi:MAG: methyltransferase domain-containing protein [Nitrospirales bacterium]|nr:methyltransferase domain-containing protein [Nitrospirales bacterium]